jgi:hypothetical protein
MPGWRVSASRRRRYLAAWPHHLRYSLARDDAALEQCHPQGVGVPDCRVGAAVPGSSHRQVQHVRPQPVHGQVAERGAAGRLVGAQEGGVGHAGGSAHALLHQVMELCTANTLGDERQDHVSAVAVGEPLAGGELGRVPVEDTQVLLGEASSCTGTGIR